MQEIIINAKYGGFTIHDEIEKVIRKCGYEGEMRGIARDNHCLVTAVKSMLTANGQNDYYGLEVIEIPDGIEWEICEYDGMEWVAEKHRKWYGGDWK